MQSRTFLNVEALPPYDGRILGELVFVSGRLRKGTAATDVLNTLIHDCQVSPFLLVADDETLLLLALGQIGAGASSRTKLPRATKSVSAALSHALADIETNIERADCVRKVVDHRYERLFPSPREGPTEGGLERPSGSSG